MQNHVKVYFEHFGYDQSDFIQCEYPGCGARGVDIEHLVPRSKFGSTRKEEQDQISNLVCICRHHHNQATFGANQKEVKAILKEVVIKRHEKD